MIDGTLDYPEVEIRVACSDPELDLWDFVVVRVDEGEAVDCLTYGMGYRSEDEAEHEARKALWWMYREVV